jgi:hypothetical protein
MALMLATSSAVGFNPVQAIFKPIAQVGIVGLDQRAIRTSISELSPMRAIGKAVERVAQHAVMSASEADMAPKKVGDYGFDPLNLGSWCDFAFMREAELKHGRLAMMAAVAWPLQEILHPIIVDAVYVATGASPTDVLFASGGASPSLLNGGLGQAEVFPALLLFAVGTSVLEESDLNARKELGCSWNEYPASSGEFGRQPGNYRFDPLNLYRPLAPKEKVAMQERELLNGRVAMMAVASYVATEFFFDTTIVRATPELFEPLIFQPGFRAFMDASFGVASMDGAIDGVAY